MRALAEDKVNIQRRIENTELYWQTTKKFFLTWEWKLAPNYGPRSVISWKPAPSPGKRCQLNRSMQHHPARWSDIACAGERSDWWYSVKTQPEQRSGWSNASKRFWLLFSMPGGSKLDPLRSPPLPDIWGLSTHMSGYATLARD